MKTFLLCFLLCCIFSSYSQSPKKEFVPVYVENSGFDDTHVLEAALNKGGIVNLQPKTIYTISRKIKVSKDVELNFNGSTIQSSNTMEMLEFENDHLVNGQGGYLITTYKSSSENKHGMICSINDSWSSGTIKNLNFISDGNANINGIKYDASNSIMERIELVNLSFENMGRMAIEIISHSNSSDDLAYVGESIGKNISSTNSGAKNKYGMIWSSSGNVKSTVLDSINGSGWTDVGIEISKSCLNHVSNVYLHNTKSKANRFLGIFDPEFVNGISSKYTANQRTIFENIMLKGEGSVQAKSRLNTIVLKNLVSEDAIILVLDNVIIEKSKLVADKIVVRGDSTSSIMNTSIELGKSSSWIDVKQGSKLNMTNVIINRDSDELSIIASENSTVTISDSRIINGYLKADYISSVFKISNSKFISPRKNNPYMGKGVFEVSNVVFE